MKRYDGRKSDTKGIIRKVEKDGERKLTVDNVAKKDDDEETLAGDATKAPGTGCLLDVQSVE